MYFVPYIEKVTGLSMLGLKRSRKETQRAHRTSFQQLPIHPQYIALSSSHFGFVSLILAYIRGSYRGPELAASLVGMLRYPQGSTRSVEGLARSGDRGFGEPQSSESTTPTSSFLFSGFMSIIQPIFPTYFGPHNRIRSDSIDSLWFPTSMIQLY